MPNLFDKAFGSGGWLAGKLEDAAGVSVTYTRGVESVTVTAVVGRTAFSSGDQGGGRRLEFSERDFLIRASELVLGGRAVEPERGDTITHDGERFELMTPETGEPAVRESDPLGTKWRIHAKRVG